MNDQTVFNSIEPTVGRMVWFRPNGMQSTQLQLLDEDTPCAAIVTYVFSTRRIRVAVFGHDGAHFHAGGSVTLRQPGDGEPAAPQPYCEWMPYQKGQAAKTETLEAQMKDAIKEQPDANPDSNVSA